MALPDPIPRREVILDVTSSALVYDVPFPFIFDMDVEVAVSTAAAPDTFARLTFPAAYMLTGAGEPIGGAAHLTAAPEVGAKIRFRGISAENASEEVVRGIRYNYLSIEKALLRLGWGLQEAYRNNEELGERVDGLSAEVSDVLGTVADAVTTATAAAGAATASAGIAAGEAVAAGVSAGRSEASSALADKLANASPGTPIGSGYSARHWAAVAQALSDNFDLSNYWTTAQILAALESYVPITRTIASGLGIKINGGASAALAGTVTVGLDLASDAETIAGLLTNKASAPSGVHAAIASAFAGLSVTGIKNVRLITASGSVTPSAGVTKWLYIIVDGGYHGGESGQGAQYKSGSGGAGGKGSIGFVSVDAATAYAVTIGAGNGGATSLVVGGATKTTTNGILNVPSANPGSPALAFNASGVQWAMGGGGGPGPFGFGNGGAPTEVASGVGYSNGNPGTGYGAGGSGGVSGNQNGNIGGADGSQGCLWILEF